MAIGTGENLHLGPRTFWNTVAAAPLSRRL
jgi:hypothetical protein